jgi:HEAT repeat protein
MSANQPALAQETEKDTVRRCLEDLQSQDAAVRRRGALVIGKYDVPEAREALARCLGDEDVQVRRSALVSLAEGHNLPEDVKMPVMQRLVDTDVEVRRLASSLLPECLGAMRRIMPVQTVGSEELPSGIGPINGDKRHKLTDGEQAEIKALIAGGLKDEDASVCQNVLRALRYYPQPVDRKLLERFLEGDSAEHILLALVAYARCQGDETERVAMVAPLVRRPEATVRGNLVRFLDTIQGEEALPVLRQLAEDGDDKVALSALRQLARRKVPEVFEKIKGRLFDGNSSLEERRQMLFCLTGYGPDALLPVCRQLLESKETPVALQAAALQMLGTREMQDKVKVTEILSLLNHPDTRMRRAVMGLMHSRQQELSQDNLRDFEKTPYPDVRESLLRWSNKQKPWQLDLARQYCVDDSAAVRLLALTVLFRERDDGWEEMAVAALEDDSTEIQMLAITQLMRMARVAPATLEAVEDYRQRCQDQKRLPMLDRAILRWKHARPQP